MELRLAGTGWGCLAAVGYCRESQETKRWLALGGSLAEIQGGAEQGWLFVGLSPATTRACLNRLARED